MTSYLRSFPFALLLLTGLLGTVVSAEDAAGTSGVTQCWRSTFDPPHFTDEEKCELMSDIVFKVGKIDVTKSAPFSAFKDRIKQTLIDTEDKVWFESCFSFANESPYGAVTATVDMFLYGNPSVNTTFAVHGSPDQVCATGTQLCRDQFEPSYNGGTLENNFIFDCSNVQGPRSDSCSGGVAWDSADYLIFDGAAGTSI